MKDQLIIDSIQFNKLAIIRMYKINSIIPYL